MKKNIRYSVWETNSSLSHSLIIMSKDEYDTLMKMSEDDNYKWDTWDEKWVTAEKIAAEKASTVDDDWDEWRYRDSYFNEYGEYEIKLFTTEHGDQVVGISYASEDY